MPLYEYECDDCGHRFERIRKFSDPPLTTCPECDGPIRKLLSPPAIQFKGTGWYVTDYARKPGDGKAAEGGADAKSAKGSDGKPGADGKSSADSKTSGGASSRSDGKASAGGASSGAGHSVKPSGSASSASSSAPG